MAGAVGCDRLLVGLGGVDGGVVPDVGVEAAGCGGATDVLAAPLPGPPPLPGSALAALPTV